MPTIDKGKGLLALLGGMVGAFVGAGYWGGGMNQRVSTLEAHDADKETRIRQLEQRPQQGQDHSSDATYFYHDQPWKDEKQEVSLIKPIS